MLVDPSEVARARRMLSSSIEIEIAPVDEFWMRDSGPTFVVDDERPGVLGAVDWIFNGWAPRNGPSGARPHSTHASWRTPSAPSS